ncbi:hypothetical protein RUM43_011167 [Polyplax serrata]|uniref:Rho GTPase-activating protein 7 n=1 Tax=Polyplax serrata TaxID=468196 RepID=A0AAN8S3J7_POLSC
MIFDRTGEDLQFPIDVSGVQKDHPFLDKDSLQSLFRRLHALNRCAKMKIDNPPKNSMDDSDEDDQCALSENWTFQPESRRWSRVCDVTNHHVDHLHNNTGSSNTSEEKPDSSIDSDRLMSSGEDLIARDDVPVIESLRYGSLPQGAISADTELIAVRFRRTNSERLRDSAKAILRRMESLKSRRRKKQHVENVTISSPQVVDVSSMQQKMKDLNCVDVSPTATSGSSPEHSSPSAFHLPANCQYLSPPFGDDSSSYCSDNSQGTPVYQRTKSKLHRAKKFFHHSKKADESGALSDSEIQPTSWKHRYVKDANSNHAKVLEYIDGRPRGPKDQEPRVSSRTPSRGGSLNLGKESQRYREQVQANFRGKGANMYIDKSGSSELTEDSSSTFASHADSDQDPMDITTRQRVTVVRWHSFQRGTLRPDSYYLTSDSNIPYEYRSMSTLSCGQLLVLRKMALLKLTACMEKYCPTHRTGWNWELPKFIRKIKTPDYKDKTVFGVPLLLSLQRSGQALPKCIQLALRWLRTNALDNVGLFRKSGVRSRIQTLKAMTENQGEMISYDGHQAYDVADMVKQYFRELPEALLTNKLSETFISIFQHVPETFRGEAVQWALLLLPDEHREALQTVLEFFNQVSARSTCNQMTSSNLAVCLAPSLFHLHHPSPGTQSRSTSAPPRRRKTVGVPDQRELGENRAAHDCLLYLMKENKEVFTVSEDMFSSCRFSAMDYSIPMTLEQLGSELPEGWRGYLKESISSFLREAKEKNRGWVSVPCPLDNHTEMAYKKVGDGHPLRLWKVWTEVEAPPQELVRRVLRERHLWDLNLLKWRVVARLDAQAEIFQFVCGSMPPLPAKDFCVLRSWKTDLPKGACVIVETSVEHPDATVLLGGVRGVVLASRYLIEPCGSGKSRIVHLSRVDTKGRSPEWYNKSYGHICAMHLSRIRTSFKHNTDGPESKV